MDCQHIIILDLTQDKVYIDFLELENKWHGYCRRDLIRVEYISKFDFSTWELPLMDTKISNQINEGRFCVSPHFKFQQ